MYSTAYLVVVHCLLVHLLVLIEVVVVVAVVYHNRFGQLHSHCGRQGGSRGHALIRDSPATDSP